VVQLNKIKTEYGSWINVIVICRREVQMIAKWLELREAMFRTERCHGQKVSNAAGESAATEN